MKIYFAWWNKENGIKWKDCECDTFYPKSNPNLEVYQFKPFKLQGYTFNHCRSDELYKPWYVDAPVTFGFELPKVLKSLRNWSEERQKELADKIKVYAKLAEDCEAEIWTFTHTPT